MNVIEIILAIGVLGAILIAVLAHTSIGAKIEAAVKGHLSTIAPNGSSAASPAPGTLAVDHVGMLNAVANIVRAASPASPLQVAAGTAELPDWQKPPIIYDATKDGPYSDFRAQHGMFRNYVSPSGFQISPQGTEIKPQAVDPLAAERAVTLLDSFGKHKVLAKGAVAYKAPSIPARAVSTGQVPQMPGNAGPSSAWLWYGATADTPRPAGLVAGLDCNNVIALPAQEGFICGESDNGGEFRIEINPGA